MFRKIFVAFMLMASMLMAFAAPSPAVIERALSAGQLGQARNMVNQVLAERPDSARAHLLNSYIILKMDRNVGAAQAELDLAASLDTKGDVRSSNLYRKTVSEIQAMTVQANVYTPPAAYIAPPPYVPRAAPVKEEGMSFFSKLIFFLLLAGGTYGIYWMIFKKNKPTETDYSTPTGTGFGNSVHDHSPTVQRHMAEPLRMPRYNPPPYQPTYQQPVQNSGPSALGTGAAVVGGVVVGSLLADSLLHRSHHVQDDDYDTVRRRRNRDDDNTFSSSSANSTWEDPTPAPYVAPTPSYNPFSSSSKDDDDDNSSSNSRYTAPEPATDYSSSSSNDSSSSDSSSSDSGNSDW